MLPSVVGFSITLDNANIYHFIKNYLKIESKPPMKKPKMTLITAKSIIGKFSNKSHTLYKLFFEQGPLRNVK